jgi:hypothetical protein
MTLEEINNRFVYVTDKEQYGVDEYWEEGTIASDGNMYMDCESYAITCKKYIEDFKDWDYYWCRMNGEGHCILSNGVDMIDNNVQRVTSLDKYKKVYEVTELRQYRWYELMWKFGSAKVLSVWLKILGK